MARIREDHLLAAVEQACMEETFRLELVAGCTDHEAAPLGGGLTARIAVIAGRPLGSVRARLHKLNKTGMLIRAGTRKSSYRWWPIGLAARANQKGEQQ